MSSLTIAALALGILLYANLIYPLLLLLIAAFQRRRVAAVADAAEQPLISVIVPVFNAHDHIVAKINNIFESDYPADKLEVLFISDCSDDGSDETILKDGRVKLFRMDQRGGKERALQRGVVEASSEIMVFTDITTRFRADAIRLFVDGFADPEVGVISSVDEMDENVSALERLHVGLEMFVREKESEFASSVGVSGSLFGARRPIAAGLTSTSTCSDLEVAFVCVSQGQRAVVDRRIVGLYKDTGKSAQELPRKIRTITQGLRTVLNFLTLRNVCRYPLYCFLVFSHKLMRWLAPLGLCVFGPAMAVSFPLLTMVSAALAFLAWVGLSIFLPKFPLSRMIDSTVGRVMVFVLAPIAAAWNVARGKDMSIWQPTRREVEQPEAS